MLGLVEFEADTCPGCGGQLSETTDPASEGRWHVGLPRRCHLCTAVSVAQKPYAEAEHNHALLWSAERK